MQVNEQKRLRAQLLSFAARAERARGESIAPSDAFVGQLGTEWEALLQRARRLTNPERLPN